MNKKNIFQNHHLQFTSLKFNHTQNWHHFVKHFPYPIRFTWTSALTSTFFGTHGKGPGLAAEAVDNIMLWLVCLALEECWMLDLFKTKKTTSTKMLKKWTQSYSWRELASKTHLVVRFESSKVVSFTMLKTTCFLSSILCWPKKMSFLCQHLWRPIFPSWRLLTFWQQKTGRFLVVDATHVRNLGSFLYLFMHGPIFVAELRSQAGKMWWFFTWLMVRWNMKPW